MSEINSNTAVANLKARGDEWVSLYEAAFLAQVDTTLLKAQMHLPKISEVVPDENGKLPKATLLIGEKPVGKKWRFNAASLAAFIESRQKSQKAGRGPNPDGRLYSIRLLDTEKEAVNTFIITNFGKTLVDVALELKDRQAKKAAEKAAAVVTA